MPAEFHLLRPAWLLVLPPAAALIWWAMRRRLRAGSWRSVIDERLLAFVLDDRAAGGRSRLPLAIALAAVTLACLALAGPTWERQKQQLYRGGDSLVIALDLSRSMDAADVAPSRLERAKLKLMDLLERRRDGQTALVVYSSHAFTVTPLTDDVDTIGALVGSLSTDIMPSRGSVPASALAKAKDLLEQAGASRGRVLLITDGAGGEAASVAAELRRAGYTTSVIGVGTSEGGPVPQAGGGFVTDAAGRMVLPGLEEGLLKDIAAAGGGIYRRLAIDDSDIAAVVAAMGRGSADPARSGEDYFTDLWHDQGPWLVLALLPLAALAFRRGWVMVLLVLALPAPETAVAAGWRDLWATPDQQGAAAYEAGRHGEAAELFRDPAWQAAARYRAGDYSASADLLADVDGADAAYNRGNALARQGDYEAAIAAYEEALAADPDNEDARYNRDLLRQLQNQQQSGGEGQPQQGESSENGEQQQGGESGEQQSSEGEQEQQSAGAESGETEESGTESQAQSTPADEQATIDELREEMRKQAEREPGDEGQEAPPQYAELSPEERSRQEQAQAMEQWLRRVPNDPGGLLRRKFMDQYRRQGRDQDGNRLWTDEPVEPW